MKNYAIKFNVKDVGPIEIDVSKSAFEKTVEYCKKNLVNWSIMLKGFIWIFNHNESYCHTTN